MKTIKKITDLPKWFTSKKYSEPKSFFDWHCELRLRRNIYTMSKLMKDMTSNRAESDDNDYHKNSKILMEDFLISMLSREPLNTNSPLFEISEPESPIYDTTVIEALYLAGSVRHRNEFKQISEKIFSVLQISNDTPYSDSSCVPIKHEDACKELFDLLETDDIYTAPVFNYTPVDNVYLSYMNDLGGVPITVNLELDNETLFLAFKEWLLNKRSESGNNPRKPYSKADLDAWNKYKVLQVFDLDMWSDITGRKITDAVISSYLWPDTDKNAEAISPIDRLRKVSRNKADRLIRQGELWRLEAQIASHEK